MEAISDQNQVPAFQTLFLHYFLSKLSISLAFDPLAASFH
ncbi:hypothetical protein QN277_012083 [Acacia crassicarpa]|uniref:Uncharacterized protein n=1 Tax=Acacia crassicarpa TaxID=499986 RepID=A0AAE1TD14_9FABA|nr:hypothetical protein QN277_012083 [Acacia crassicarpa]